MSPRFFNKGWSGSIIHLGCFGGGIALLPILTNE